MSDDRYIAFEEKIGISEVLSSIREWLDDYKEGYEEHKELREILEKCEKEIHNYIDDGVNDDEGCAIDNALDTIRDRQMGI